MVGTRKDFFDPELSASFEEELRRGFRTVVRQDMTLWTVRENPVVKKAFATAYADVLRRGTVLVSLVKRSFITSRKRFP
jgi:hypothetical protein